MRYFLDTEYNGFGGELISLALVPEHGDQEYYAVLPLPDEIHPWVERNVVPYLGSVPPGHHAEPVSRLSAAARSEEHTSELQSLMRISYAVFCLQNKKTTTANNTSTT